MIFQILLANARLPLANGPSEMTIICFIRRQPWSSMQKRTSSGAITAVLSSKRGPAPVPFWLGHFHAPRVAHESECKLNAVKTATFPVR